MSFLRGLCLTTLAGAVILQQKLAKDDEKKHARKYNRNIPISWAPPSRERTLSRIKDKKYDIVIIGGGSVGAGCMLDAATRGYSVLLLEKNDFASGTSSKSTKLIHGGIRYLEKAIKELDYKQLSLVVEGLRERKSFLNLAPYLTREVGILLPIRHKLTVPYFWMGTKVYDFLSGRLGIQKSYFIGKEEVRKVLSSIDYKKIAGGMVYFDGQMDDSRVNTMLVETGIYYGGSAINYAEVTNFIKKENKSADGTKENSSDRIVGVSFKDTETGIEHTVQCKGVINATGPYSDTIRRMDVPNKPKIIVPSIGVHLVMPGAYTGKLGMLNPSTKNGSVLFLIPWKGVSIAGTTDREMKSMEMPKATEKDVKYIVREMGEFIEGQIAPKAKNILSAWAGIRPLTRDTVESADCTSIVRSHLIDRSETGLVTVSGGKWTSYREIAEEAIDASAKFFSLPNRPCVTKYVRLIGSHQYERNLAAKISREFKVSEDIAAHLVSTYGDRAHKVCVYANGKYDRIDPRYPYIKAEIPYSIDHEHARKVSDYIGRRSMFAYLNVRHAHSSVPAVLKEFAAHMKWSKVKQKSEEKEAYEYLDTMGYGLLKRMEEREVVFDDFKSKLLNQCKNSICEYSSAKRIIEKTFGQGAGSSFNGRFKKDSHLPMRDVIDIIKTHFNILQ
ncbi:glycerol-3-phosphate dehydrogenase [Nematocida minor]|uniref:glycerol-3-phosphate dehydrogenase n=1 Tax=Nematocida minor TaxID=1912983 RepID=UPI00221F88DC|nr:glycerol-3-phosphate dehydrogenase [Nematocida minor]KAI5193348.1 glycerol-3-phosphate dehydrogenase [Nematocida minor]